MFMSFSKTIAKVGGFRFGIRMRLTKSNALWYFLALAVVYTCQLIWYSMVVCLWVMYAFVYGIYIGIKKVFILLSKRFGKLIATAIIVGFFGFLVSLGSCNHSGNDEPSAAVPAPTQTTATEATTMDTAEQETMSASEAVEAWKSKVEAEMAVFDYYNVTTDETSATVSFASNGYAQKVSEWMAAGYYESWSRLKNESISVTNYFCECAEEYGLKEYPITLILLDDQNHDNKLFIISNGEVTYDCMVG